MKIPFAFAKAQHRKNQKGKENKFYSQDIIL
jgi:hypothetical protein